MVELAILLIFPAAMCLAGSSDLFTMTISNRLSLSLVAAFFAMALVTGLPLATIGWHVVAGILMLALCFFAFAMGWMGGGDAKLAAATALWLGFGTLPQYLMLATLLGGVLTLGLLYLRTLPLPALLAQEGWAQRLHDKKTGIPYGIALAAAGLAIYPTSFWMHGF